MNQEDLRNAFLIANEDSTNVFIGGKDYSDAEFAAVISNLPPLTKLRSIELGGTKVGNLAVEALARAAEAELFPQLQTLRLGGAWVGNKGAEALARAAEARGLLQLQTL